jgi:hypothetical protein
LHSMLPLSGLSNLYAFQFSLGFIYWQVSVQCRISCTMLLFFCWEQTIFFIESSGSLYFF